MTVYALRRQNPLEREYVKRECLINPERTLEFGGKASRLQQQRQQGQGQQGQRPRRAATSLSTMKELEQVEQIEQQQEPSVFDRSGGFIYIRNFFSQRDYEMLLDECEALKARGGGRRRGGGREWASLFPFHCSLLTAHCSLFLSTARL